MQRVREQIGVSEQILRRLPEKDVTVAVLDSGIAAHPDLRGKLLCFKDFIHHKSVPYDDNGHGTHVCGIICGNGVLSQGKYQGISGRAKLVVGKVLDGQGEGSADCMLEALSWIYKVRDLYHIRILNISVGIGCLKEKEKSAALKAQLEKLWNCGITVVCAAGNTGPEDDSITAIGAKTRVITVGCHDGEFCKGHPKCCESYSARGIFGEIPRKPDIVAPGTDIVSCNADWKQSAYTKKSGTSMATPIVSGVLALALQKEPKLSNEDLRQKLTFSAKDLGEAWNKQGWGMVDVKKFLQY